MAIKNTRKHVTENQSENRLRNKLKEGYKRFITEAGDGDEDLDMDLDAEDDSDMDLGDDSDLDIDGAEGDGEGMMGDEDMGEDMQMNPLDDLTDTEAQQVDAWIDELLGDSIEQVQVDGAESLDTEIPSADINPMGEDSFVHSDLPMTSDDLQNIIDSDDSLNALETELADLAVEQDEEQTDPSINTMDTMDTEDTMDDELTEAEDPMKGIDKYFEQGFEGEDVKDELQENIELAPDNKELGFEKTKEGLNDKITSTVKPMEGSRSKEDIEKDQKGVVTESHKLSKMLIKAATIIEKQKQDIAKKAKMMEALKLENYRLLKTNGLLSVAGDILSKEARTQISEGFDKCGSVDQVNKFYNKLTEKIKGATRPSLNQTVNSNKTKISVIKESAEKKEKLSQDQLRKNMLMGIPTDRDVYFE